MTWPMMGSASSSPLSGVASSNVRETSACANEREQFSPCWLCKQMPVRSRCSTSLRPASRTRRRMSWSSPQDVSMKEKVGKRSRR